MGNIKCMPQGFKQGVAVELGNLVVAAYDQFRARAGRPSKWPLSAPYQLLNTVSLAATAVAELNLTGLDNVARDIENVPLIGPRVTRPLNRVRSLLDGDNYEHVGTPVDFTQHNGSIVANHEMETYLAALGIQIATPLAQTAASSNSP